MNLLELVAKIDNQDQDAIIFLAEGGDYSSDVILDYPEDGDNGVKAKNGKAYTYLLEVFLAKEFIDDWVGSQNERPSNEAIAKRLFEYAINDA